MNAVNSDLVWLLFVRVQLDDHAPGTLVPRLDLILDVEVVTDPGHLLGRLERFTQRQDGPAIEAHLQSMPVAPAGRLSAVIARAIPERSASRSNAPRPSTPALRPLLLQTRGRLAVPDPWDEVDAFEGAALGDAVGQLAREADAGGPVVLNGIDP